MKGSSVRETSPFRETEWDHRLDKMLDDLKTTVQSDAERSSGYRGDTSLASSFRSSSRNESSTSNRIEDAGLMRHHHKEYTSPDKSTRIVTDEYEYDSGDPAKSGKFQKKVKKSTYSTYNVTGGISDQLDSLREAPPAAVTSSAADSKVVTASQKVANKLVHALSSIGADPLSPPFADTNTLTTTSDYSTLTRLDKDITDLDTILEKMEREELAKKKNSHNHQRTEKTIYHPESKETRTTESKVTRQTKTTSNDQDPYFVSPSSLLPNGSHTKYDDDMEMVDDGQGGEVRRIVWRNRFEKTHESHDSTSPKVLTIEEDARRRMRKQENYSSTTSSTLHPIPPQISPGSSWADPIAIPTPPQVSPGEPGVAYVYTYGQEGGSKVQHLPPLNYVAGPPLADGTPSPVPSGAGQPIIYHYSYHYTLQPGQQPPEGPHQSPGSISSHQPALQFAPQPRYHTPTNTLDQPKSPTSYNYQSHHTTNVNRSEATQNYHTKNNSPSTPGPRSFPIEPEDNSPPFPRSPRPDGPNGPNSNVSITINKTTTRTTHSKDFGGPTTSTPAPDRYTKGPNTTSYTTRTTYHNDSLERLKKPYQDTVAFPDTSPIKPVGDNEIPRQVDDLMNTLDSQRHESKVKRQLSFTTHTPIPTDEDSINPTYRQPYARNGGPVVESKPLLKKEKSEERELVLEKSVKRDETKNLAGPPVYYPPGHHQLFDESMHTMTLKENKRKGQAKWRRERAASAKESHSESKGGAAMVPVCLPLCCGAACVVM